MDGRRDKSVFGTCFKEKERQNPPCTLGMFVFLDESHGLSPPVMQPEDCVRQHMQFYYVVSVQNEYEHVLYFQVTFLLLLWGPVKQSTIQQYFFSIGVILGGKKLSRPVQFPLNTCSPLHLVPAKFVPLSAALTGRILNWEEHFKLN